MQYVGLRAVRPGLFTWCSAAVKWLEAAREAESGRVLFASMSVVMNGHVFVENGLCGAVQWGNKDAGHLADGQTVKNCAIQKHRCFAFYTRSLWGSQKVHFLRIYMATARLTVDEKGLLICFMAVKGLNVQLPCKYVRNTLWRLPDPLPVWFKFKNFHGLGREKMGSVSLAPLHGSTGAAVHINQPKQVLLRP